MKRNNINPTAILTSDWHIRENTPECRTDDFEMAQWHKVKFIAELQKKYACPVLHAGDLFDHWKPSPYLLSSLIDYIPNQFFTVYGQHDLPQHNLDLRYKSGIHTMQSAGKLTVLPGTHWNQEITYTSLGGYTVLVWHSLTWVKKSPFPGVAGSGEAYKVLRKHAKKASLIVTGDNHQSFTASHGDCILVNPGNITRQSAAQVDFEPAVYLWFADTHTVRRVPLPIQKDVISREHIEKKQKRDARIDAFVQRLDDGEMEAIDFEANLQQYIMSNEGKIHKDTLAVLYKAMDDEDIV